MRAVVLETTGDVSVLTGSGPVDPDILDAGAPHSLRGLAVFPRLENAA